MNLETNAPLTYFLNDVINLDLLSLCVFHICLLICNLFMGIQWFSNVIENVFLQQVLSQSLDKRSSRMTSCCYGCCFQSASLPLGWSAQRQCKHYLHILISQILGINPTSDLNALKQKTEWLPHRQHGKADHSGLLHAENPELLYEY